MSTVCRRRRGARASQVDIELQGIDLLEATDENDDGFCDADELDQFLIANGQPQPPPPPPLSLCMSRSDHAVRSTTFRAHGRRATASCHESHHR